MLMTFITHLTIMLYYSRWPLSRAGTLLAKHTAQQTQTNILDLHLKLHHWKSKDSDGATPSAPARDLIPLEQDLRVPGRIGQLHGTMAISRFSSKYDWEKTKSPAGAYQWTPKEQAVDILVPDAHDSAKTHAPMMFTTDMSLKMDPTYLVRGSLVSMFFEQFKLVLSNFMTTKRHTHNGSKNTHHHY